MGRVPARQRAAKKIRKEQEAAKAASGVTYFYIIYVYSVRAFHQLFKWLGQVFLGDGDEHKRKKRMGENREAIVEEEEATVERGLLTREDHALWQIGEGTRIPEAALINWNEEGPTHLKVQKFEKEMKPNPDSLTNKAGYWYEKSVDKTGMTPKECDFCVHAWNKSFQTWVEKCTLPGVTGERAGVASTNLHCMPGIFVTPGEGLVRVAIGCSFPTHGENTDGYNPETQSRSMQFLIALFAAANIPCIIFSLIHMKFHGSCLLFVKTLRV
jgi:hypothetical protein